MDQQNFQPSGLFGSYLPEPSLNVPVPSGAGTSISPYLNVDPYYLNQGGPQFIVPTGQARARGRFELAFSQIGSSVMAGAIYGALNGTRISARETKELSGKVRVSQMLNLVTKQGASSANSIGVIALMYSVLGLGLSWGRATEDELNTVGAATATGLLYKSSAGIKKMAKGGVIGLGLASAWCLWQNKDKLKTWSVQSL
ncbi:mitochondrial import inner membrane translocase subunit Tim23-like [Acanthaster planci]|uniref:Mitochondrial import inner membrane translocase subunit Tim23-like n=1 Tax=Acanthaster planci TaxID=133434 RepID=A0A8B7YHP3_ACAPL|nr:mitochondrial import inner membrane translocase subunit Tim23-like [Acanthaster planci]